MTNEELIIERFLRAYPEYEAERGNLEINIWGDVFQGKGRQHRRIANSDLHDLPMSKLGYKLPKSWKLCQEGRK